MRALFITNDNEIIGQTDYTRYNKLPKWKKIICFFFKSYKIRFIDVKGFDVKIKMND